MDYDKYINPVARDIKPSGIRKFFDISATMDDVISLGVGEPDFPTPWHIRMSGINSLEEGKTRYTANRGSVELRREIAVFMKRKYGLSYDPEQEVLITVGGSEAIDIAVRALVQSGDEVLIPQPSFVCYEPIVSMAGGTPVTIDLVADNGFVLTAKQIEEKITPQTKVLILPYPGNPTGAIMTKEQLEAIKDVIIKNDLMVISDEIYAELTYNEKGHVSVASIDGLQERTVVVSGFSKTYSMTGWRLGFACAPKEILQIMTKIHQFAIMCAPTTAQYAAVEALKNGDDDIFKMKQEYNARRRLIVNGFNKMGLTCFEPLGAFYIFPCIKSTGMSSDEFCEKLLYSKKVAVVPGNAFGECGEGFVRASYCYSVEHIKEALKRIEEFLSENK
ncbi:MAG: aminotransferase class I/II-fold pyridoxal phosphate-dependent enzyme [Oscillospiraceae bacterium]|nr:aminotransferase class I/II-fold pyridoxal phosphate-dependent enzyme [Candidatus Equicaccousia limihippi]